ncbi:hypothetical protein PAXRUDRAFT_17338 [Paxillus rubicundulus Ve08.2h10]|uniref:CxC5 like cysteine cluster associated with KDZ domain-containing protein n=1 Tax=Paxillus rubicundulus Ve08.2h10 TaxID=930991 RepID=A0A0D0C3D0_9AGAM|nr:hypothetical protein PAXRUDRAFT_17338 [Paxillus rubicundulus Ve08.2h10]
MQDVQHSPLSLLQAVVYLLADVLDLDVDLIHSYWTELQSAVWCHNVITPSTINVKRFNACGRAHGIAYGDLYQPTCVCLLPDCPNFQHNNDIATLSDPVKYKATHFTLCFGAVPIHSMSTYSRKCLRQYHYNYVIDKGASSRTYYHGVPDVIKAATHYFIDTTVLELFATVKVFGWLSSMTCAWIYNTALWNVDSYILSNPLAFSSVIDQYKEDTVTWPCLLQMHDEDVLNGFFIYSLLLDKAE